MVRTYGSDALVKLIRSYKDGRTDDEAFQAGLGVGTAAFAAAWLADLGAKAPTRYGPQPAPPGPIPSAWLAEGGLAAPVGGGGRAVDCPGIAGTNRGRRRRRGAAGPGDRRAGDRDRPGRGRCGAAGAGRGGDRRRDAPLDPHPTELAGHPGRGTAGTRLPGRRPAVVRGSARPLHDPGTDAAARDRRRAADAAGRPDGPDPPAAGADPGRRRGGRRLGRPGPTAQQPSSSRRASRPA